ncbi:hypothetical protein EVAR_16475_1 [Eumeta japonica]|uniref:Uncharacterized protein n=1 Tax=Eumeta variegata TaxID=151549 RepID=A0A4C1UKA4_EUMVA|nr:hypothetical protein EVAR_16475_1 [Eumeta japonica]
MGKIRSTGYFWVSCDGERREGTYDVKKGFLGYPPRSAGAHETAFLYQFIPATIIIPLMVQKAPNRGGVAKSPPRHASRDVTITPPK